MEKTVVIKCPCGVAHNKVYLSNPKGNLSRRWGKCSSCKKDFEYQIVNGKCVSWYK